MHAPETRAALIAVVAFYVAGRHNRPMPNITMPDLTMPNSPTPNNPMPNSPTQPTLPPCLPGTAWACFLRWPKAVLGASDPAGPHAQALLSSL